MMFIACTWPAIWFLSSLGWGLMVTTYRLPDFKQCGKGESGEPGLALLTPRNWLGTGWQGGGGGRGLSWPSPCLRRLGDRKSIPD